MESEPDSVSVLLIDERPSRAEGFVRALAAARSPQFDVRVVGSVQEGLDACGAAQFDMVVLGPGETAGGERLLALRGEGDGQAVDDLRDAQRIGRMGSWRVELPSGAWAWSPELFRLVGLPPAPDGTPDPSLLEYVHPDDRQRVAVAFERARRGSPFELECRIVAAGGVHRSLNIIGRPDPERLESVLGTAQDVTELRAVERALRSSRAQLVAQRELLSGVVNHAPIGMAISRPDGRFVRVNRALCEILGREEHELLRLSLDAVTEPDDVAETQAAMRALLSGEIATLRAETRCRHRDGRTIWAELAASLIRDEHGQPLHVVAQLADISEHKEIERALREERDRTAAIMAAMGEGYLLTIDSRITDVNDAICAITGFTREELLGTEMPWPFCPPEFAEEYARLGERVVAAHGGTFEAQLVRRDGSRFEAEITARVALQPDGTPLGWVSTVRDVSERRRYEAELERLATHDPLTGLANHRLFHQRLGEEIASAIRHQRQLSVAILDLDHFKQINDRFGHVVGDQALVTVAERLSGVVRDGELLARVGGEEFAWILPDADADGVFIAAERARQAIGDRPLAPIGQLTISIGVATRETLREASALYERADAALYRAKREGRDRTISWDGASAPVVGSSGADV